MKKAPKKVVVVVPAEPEHIVVVVTAEPVAELTREQKIALEK